tara:strand:- start:53 stop:316 length:264 start_codon:yes stop_codon:yes gene_type:complete
MSQYSLIRLLSLTIFIAKKKKHTILPILLYDYAKAKLTRKQCFIICLLVCYYEKENDKDLEEKALYKIIDIYLSHHSSKLCKQLLMF